MDGPAIMSVEGTSLVATTLAPRREMVPRARPVIELNLNVDEAMVEAVDLVRSIRVQVESLSGTLNDNFNRTMADAGDDIGKIIHNVEAITGNLVVSTAQLYQPLLFALLFLLVVCILFAILFCIIFRTRWEMRRLYKRSLGDEPAEKRRRRREAKNRRCCKWLRRWRGGRAADRPGEDPPSADGEKDGPPEEGYHEASTLRHQKGQLV